MTLKELLPQLDGVSPNGTGWMARCPAHDDSTPSLSLSNGTQGVVFHCHAGCSPEDILSELGLHARDLFYRPRTEGVRDDRVYTYTDMDGGPLFQVVRRRPKGFVVRHRCPEAADEYTWGLGGNRVRCACSKVAPVLYCLPELVEAIALEKCVFVVEGEKDVETLRRLGVPATTNIGGAGKWETAYTEVFQDADVIVLPDNDVAGRKHAHDVAASLASVCSSVRVLELPVPTGGDVSTWMDSDGSAEKLYELSDAGLPWAKWMETHDDALEQAGPQSKSPTGRKGSFPEPTSVLDLLAEEEPDDQWLVVAPSARGSPRKSPGDPDDFCGVADPACDDHPKGFPHMGPRDEVGPSYY